MAENRAMTNSLFQLGAAFAGLVTFAFLSLEGKDLAQEFGLVEEDEPVLVFTIPRPNHLAKVRAAISPDRILVEDELGFTLKGGRVYVSDVGQAGALIKSSGWIDQPIQIVGLGMDDGGEDDSGVKPSMTPGERLARMHELVKQPTLSRGEQMFVLAAMNDGIEI